MGGIYVLESILEFHTKQKFEDGEIIEFDGKIKRFKDYGHSYEMYIEGYGHGLTVVFGEYTNGWFMFQPDFNTGAKLGSLDDTLYNFESISRTIEDPIVCRLITSALKEIAAAKDLLGRNSFLYQQRERLKELAANRK